MVASSFSEQEPEESMGEFDEPAVILNFLREPEYSQEHSFESGLQENVFTSSLIAVTITELMQTFPAIELQMMTSRTMMTSGSNGGLHYPGGHWVADDDLESNGDFRCMPEYDENFRNIRILSCCILLILLTVAVCMNMLVVMVRLLRLQLHTTVHSTWSDVHHCTIYRCNRTRIKDAVSRAPDE